MAEDEHKPARRRWLNIVATVFIGLVIPIGIAWYTIYRSESQAVLAEAERARNVRASIVAIVEESVINEKPLETSRIARLIDLRRTEDRVTTPISAAEVVGEAEFNILNTRYLDFKQKDKYKNVFDDLYKDLRSNQFTTFKNDVPHADLLNDLAKSIQEAKAGEALGKLAAVVESYRSDLSRAESNKPKKLTWDDFMHVFVQTRFIVIFVLYIIIFGGYYFWRFRRVRAG